MTPSMDSPTADDNKTLGYEMGQSCLPWSFTLIRNFDDYVFTGLTPLVVINERTKVS